MGLLPTLQFPSFVSLPYDVQEHILALVDHKATFLSLAVTCKHLSELCVRRMYEALEFSASDAGKKYWSDFRNIPRLNSLRSPQHIYIRTLKAKPELAALTRHLTWDISDAWSWNLETLPICEVWAILEQLAAIRTLDLRANVSSYAPRPPTCLFPNLVRARVQGTFPQHALEQILFTSPNIKHLTIAPSAREYLHRPGEPHAYGTSVEPFLRASISRQAFCALRTLDLGLHECVDPGLAIQFIEMSAERIEELRIEYTFGDPSTAYENRVVPMLQNGRWKRLRKLNLPKIILPKESTTFIRSSCPLLASVL
ncbi:hypothetical protein FRC08_002927 [Ceratobasidium sp. 394]|nr:hypothetical protein FRC08_002927 [Ceratobasidium sp. 394]